MPAVVPVVRAETYYLPPPPRRGQPAQDWSQVPGAELVYLWLNYRMNRRMVPPEDFVLDALPVYARINQNRWLGDCPDCGNAAIVSVLDLRFGCTECGRDWVELIAPEDVAAVEEEMLAIPQPTYRNWWHPDDPNNPDAPEPDPEPAPEAQP